MYDCVTQTTSPVAMTMFLSWWVWNTPHTHLHW